MIGSERSLGTIFARRNQRHAFLHAKSKGSCMHACNDVSWVQPFLRQKMFHRWNQRRSHVIAVGSVDPTGFWWPIEPQLWVLLWTHRSQQLTPLSFTHTMENLGHLASKPSHLMCSLSKPPNLPSHFPCKAQSPFLIPQFF